MLMTKKCLKCGAISEVDLNDASAACGKCGAIFAKVEAAKTPRATESIPPPIKIAPAPAPPASHAPSGFGRAEMHAAPFASGDRAFLAGLRATTNYPMFRAVNNFFYWFWLLLAAMTALGTVISLFRDPGLLTAIGGVFLTVFLVFLGRLLREVSMMFADIGDATIYTAEHSQTVRQP